MHKLCGSGNSKILPPVSHVCNMDLPVSAWMDHSACLSESGKYGMFTGEYWNCGGKCEAAEMVWSGWSRTYWDRKIWFLSFYLRVYEKDVVNITFICVKPGLGDDIRISPELIMENL